MMYRVRYSEQAAKQLRKIDNSTQKLILNWIGKNLEGCTDPRAKGKGRTANRSGQWRYRVGDYRILAEIQEERIVILVFGIGHRKEL